LFFLFMAFVGRSLRSKDVRTQGLKLFLFPFQQIAKHFYLPGKPPPGLIENAFQFMEFVFIKLKSVRLSHDVPEAEKLD